MEEVAQRICGCSSLKTSKIRLGRALSNLVELNMALLIEGGVGTR